MITHAPLKPRHRARLFKPEVYGHSRFEWAIMIGAGLTSGLVLLLFFF